MDGSSSVVIPSASVPGGLAREDALFRIVYYGEALRAMTEHVSDALISGPCVPMIDLLDEAFDRMSETRDSFGPEEFTLFVMSKMLGLCDDVDEARQFQIGAAKYILKSAESLPDDYRPVIDDARQMLQRTAPLAVTAENGTSKPEVPHPAETQLRDEASSPAESRSTARNLNPTQPPGEKAVLNDARPAPVAAEQTSPVRPALPTSQAPRGSAAAQPQRSRVAPAPKVGSTTALHTRNIAARVPRIHLKRSRDAFHFVERFIFFSVFAFALGLIVLVAFGYIDVSDLDGAAGERGSITTR